VNRQTLLIGGIAVLVVAVAIGLILVSTRKNRVELAGDILKVRTFQMDPEHTLALIDVRLHNPSTQQFMVRDVEVIADTADGKPVPAELFAESDVQRVLDYYPMLGKKYNPGLLRRDRINSQQTVDRTVSVSFPATDEQLARRKRIHLIVHDADGATTELTEHR